jgi:membrane-bound lytic murein transglycosylase C
MKKILATILLTTSIFAGNNDYKDFQNQFGSDYQNYEQQTQIGFKNYKKSLEDGFKEYKASLDKEFSEYKKSLSNYWDNPELSTKTTFVEYSKDKKLKKKVDYQNNEIEIQVISNDKTSAQKSLAKALFSLSTEDTNQAFRKNPVLTKVNKKLINNPKLRDVIKATKPSKEPIVKDMLFKPTVTQKEIIRYSINKVKKEPIKVKQSKVPNMKVYTIKIKLPSKAFLAKAKIYKGEVIRRAQQFKLTPEFIYGIIHTESSFNPMARSYVPAFGLMQIVPSSAGADAYKMLYGKKKILTPSYLYNSKNNILIGSAYLKRVYYGYMRKIKNPISRLYCTIAAYNTGAGNVACAFNSTSKDSNGKTQCIRSRGDYNIIKASEKINRLSSNQVYDKLLKDLKYDEPKNYLKRVTKRMGIYHKALTQNAL